MRKNFLMWKGSMPQLVVTESELIKEILNNKDGTYLKPDQPYLKKLFGDGLVTTRGEKWFKLRKMADHAFHGESLKRMVPDMVASTEVMIERWKQQAGNEIEVFRDFKLLTSELLEAVTWKGSAYLICLRRWSSFSPETFTLQILKSKDDKESDKLEQGIRDSFVEMVKKREEAAMMGQIDEDDFFGQLLKVYRDPDKRNRLTMDDLIDECKNFYIAGHETTTSALAWTIFLLAVHTDWQEKVRREVLDLFGRQNPRAEGISKLKTMSMVIYESLRLYPPIVGVGRRVEKAARLGNLTIPGTMDFLVRPSAVHHDPEIWGDDVQLFKPERFAEGVAKACNNNTAAFIPFGLGPRNCVGMNFAYNETKIALSMILQRYSFTLSPSYVHSPVVMGTILIYLSGCMFLGFLWVLAKFFNKVWWTPLRIQSAMKPQGVKGPSYKFLHGNAKEIIKLKKEAMKRSMELCHQSFPIVQPHIHLWKMIYGKNLLVWKGSTPQLVVTEPELIKEILNTKDGTYLKPESLPYLKKLFGDGLVVTRGEKWFKLRKLANHAFHGESLKRWKKHVGNEIEVSKEFKLLTSEVISRTAFGSSYLEGQRVFDMLTKMLLIFSRNINKARIPVIGQILKTKDDIESEKLEQGIRESIIKIIKKREEAAMQGQMDGIGSDFLGQLVKVYGDPDERNRITVDDLIDECKNFYIAGQETTLSALTWTVFLLAVHTDWQEKVRTEVLELLGQQNPTAEMISKLKTMNMVINESLRLYPPIVNIVREVQKGAKLANITLPDTMEVHILPLALHYDPVIWGSDVHLFKPERFAEGVAKASNNSSTVSFLPFGLGPRSCVGVNFAYNEIKIALSMILQRYRFTLSPSYVHSPFLREVWWTPIFMQSMMRKQGIKGPSYRLIHGNTKEIISMRKQSRTNPMELSHHHILPRIQPQIYSWTKIYGMNFLSWYGTRAQLVVTDIELIKEMLTNKEEIYGKIGFQGYITKLLGDGLVLSRGEKWLKIRKLANHAFHSESLKDMVPAMIKSAEMMLERWRCLDGKEVEVFEEFKVLTSEIISRTAFSSSYLEGEKIFDIYLFRPKDDIEADKLNQGIRDIIINMVNKREREVTIGKQDSYGRDFLGLLLKSMHNQDKTEKITVDDLIDECKNFYVAGHETTTSSLSWTILLLATHMDWQEKARKEMTMIINESLRLYPPVFHITRKVKRDVRLGNLVIPQNMEVYVPSLAVHHDQKIWGADAHLFKPERFAEGLAKVTNNNASAFLPFGLGPRNCVGLNFAMTEEKIALSMILQRYRFTLSPTYVHSPVDVLTLHPQHGLQIILEAL
ncbi:hypothetical protein Tsubulata_017989 [Turnera subulata]|uniref:Cytochrome P450 n=1 Tax=Turnera subulata TaxID=218843 RepID=A0A9Q0F535_9ROSI|nr:hypothetical protein Tsubulata_017989 [Turnera subulata]